jgi:hypothetical protein
VRGFDNEECGDELVGWSSIIIGHRYYFETHLNDNKYTTASPRLMNNLAKIDTEFTSDQYDSSRKRHSCPLKTHQTLLHIYQAVLESSYLTLHDGSSTAHSQ